MDNGTQITCGAKFLNTFLVVRAVHSDLNGNHTDRHYNNIIIIIIIILLSRLPAPYVTRSASAVQIRKCQAER